ncbi:hypothetical protein VE03_02422 [Pseudogymnoascus sp. 23342-1-I1]|nr:hypothetical protein VE03_02422 [Pseudogymnoascus sp. 23342-1-I1]
MDFLDLLSLNDRKLTVGIDFGTTFSGVAWAETRRPDHISIIETWPSRLGTREGMSSPKVPTELRYTDDGTEWGFQISPTIDRHQWFKLGIAESRTLAGGGTPEELTTDYLTKLYEHIMYTLEQKIGPAVLRKVPLEFCLTVPAIWSESAKEKTLKACQKAGLRSNSEILLVSEPEAAAICALHGLDPHGLDIGDTFVLCDAGGGTVDLISYTITALHPILQVKEAAGGTGDLCGSTFLNRRFGDYLTRKLGGEAGWDNEILAEAMDKFDTVIKKQYAPQIDGDDGYTILVPGLGNNPKLGILRGRYTIKPADMKAIFEPVIKKVIDLVNGQISASERKIRAVLLVGGFGQNNYLKERLRAALGELEVLQPPNAWTAVVRGAVMMGLSRANPRLSSVSVMSRAARKHYGVELHVSYESTIHNKSEMYWCERHEAYRVRAMHWLICKGDAVEENKPHEITFRTGFPISEGKPKSATLTIWADPSSLEAPVHNGPSVSKLVTLEADLTHLQKSDLDKTIQTYEDGLEYYVIAGSIEATFFSASTKYVLRYQGKRYDTLKAEYV